MRKTAAISGEINGRKTENGFTSGLTNPVYGAIVFGDEFLARAIALDGELVTDGVHDFGREIKIGWYGIWGQKALRPFSLDRAVLVYTA